MSEGPLGKIRSPLNVVLLTIVTLGIYGIVWQYLMFSELKAHRGVGIGGGLGLVLAIIFPFANVFIMPSEVGNGQEASSIPRTVQGTTGLWVLIPLAGIFIWLWKVQHATNAYWVANGQSYV